MPVIMTEEFTLALSQLNAGKSLLITGKAGTGKSTILRHWLNSTKDRNILITAPTGVAALNIDGFTIHRSFGIRPGMYPDDFLRTWKPSSRVREILKNVDALVVDEISMVRADLFDMMDFALRYIRGTEIPFGGVQLVLVGDLLQLPPVVDTKERKVFESRWETPYFFSSNVFRKLRLQNIYLTTVWRQADTQFLEILNQVREGNVGKSALEVLNQLVDPKFQTSEGWVTLASRRNRVERINESRLKELNTRKFTSHARYTGKFNAGSFTSNSFPGSEELTYAIGARVMTIINDANNRFVNGSFGTITRATSQYVVVHFDHSGEEVEIGKHTWEIKQPTISGGMISSEVIGAVTQFPIILAWAITIHKAQGKTIPKLFVDLSGGTPTEGQFYVALSRAVDLKNLRFSAPIKSSYIRANNSLVRRIRREVETGELSDRLVILSFDGVDFGISNHIARVHAIILKRGETIAEFGSWINPMVDLGDFGERNNIPSGGLAMAPTIGDFWPLLLRQSAGGVVIADRLPMLERAVRHQEKSIDLALGYGYEATELNIDISGDDVMQRCRSIRDALINRQQFSIYGHPVPRAAQNTEGAVFIPSWAPVSPMLLDLSRATASDRAWAAYSGGDIVNQDRHELIETAELLSAWALSRGSWTIAEFNDLNQRAARLGLNNLDLPNIEEPDSNVEMLLIPGTRVAFTGVTNLFGEFVDDDMLEQVCLEKDLVYVKAVSKTRCDVLVAYDRSSMSRKAQNAREYGKSIISLGSFEQWYVSPKLPLTELLQRKIDLETGRDMSISVDSHSGDIGTHVSWEIPEKFFKEGTRVAFRGSTVVGNKLYPHGEALQTLCNSLGLEYKQAVTKTRCDLLVTESAEGNDGKIKLAHRYGIPLMHHADFSRWAIEQLKNRSIDENISIVDVASPECFDDDIVDELSVVLQDKPGCLGSNLGVSSSPQNDSSFVYPPSSSCESLPSFNKRENFAQDQLVSESGTARQFSCTKLNIPSSKTGRHKKAEVCGSTNKAAENCKKFGKYSLILFLLMILVAGLAPYASVLDNVGSVMAFVLIVLLGFTGYFAIKALIDSWKKNKIRKSGS